MTTPADLAAAAAVLRQDNRPDLHGIAAGIEAFVAGEVDSLDDALGLRGRPGIATPQTLARLQRRNVAITAASERYSGTPGEIGRELHSALLRYAQSNWRTDRHLEEAPPGRLHLWTILKQGDGDFPGAARLAQIIRKNE